MSRVKEVGVATFIWACLYLRSLEGGDLESIKKKMGSLGACLLMSILLFTWSVWRTLTLPTAAAERLQPWRFARFPRLSKWCRIVCAIYNRRLARYAIAKDDEATAGGMYHKRHQYTLLLVNAVTLLILALYDRGVDFQRHGAYNFLIFCMIGIPLNLIVATILLWWRMMTPRRFAQTFTSVNVLLAIAIVVRLHQRMSVADSGFLGAVMIKSTACSGGNEVCNVSVCSPPTTIPWLDILPARAQTFWTGQAQCAPTTDPAPANSLRARSSSGKFKASLTNGFLKIDCPMLFAYYTMAPDTRAWPYRDKLSQPLGNTLQDNIIRYLENHTEMYNPSDSRGVYVGAASDTFIAFCGDASEMVTQINLRSDVTAKIRRWQARRDGPGVLPPNVLMLFMDAVSRRQFFKRLPKTKKALEVVHLDGQMSLYQFFRYHSVGFNTDLNTRGLFAGVDRDYSRYYTPIWRELREQGDYITAVVGGHCEDWSALYQEKLGGPSTGSDVEFDYEFSTLACLPEYEPVKWTDRGNFKGYTSITPRCVKGRHVHEWELDYTTKFIQRFNGEVPWFLLTTFMEGHEGTGEVLGQVDLALSQFVQNTLPLNNTMVIIVSDHGPHMGLNFLYLADGRVNHRYPFLTLLASNDLLSTDPIAQQNLENNQQRFVISADVYATMKHLVQSGYNWSSLNKTNATSLGWPRATQRLSAQPFDVEPVVQGAGDHTKLASRPKLSLFTPVSPQRSCPDVNIPSATCVCA